MGAKSRLLPVWVPFRYFAAAAVFHVAAWAMLAAAWNEVPDFLGGPGPALAAVHALTLGVIVMTAMGASFQLLPVVASEPLMAVWPCRAASWLYIPGVAVLVFGIFTGNHHLSIGGAIAAAAALLVFAVLMADILLRTRGMRLLVLHVWAALASLLVLAALGLALIADVEHGFLPDHDNAALAHMIVAVYGFMGMLALGYSNILVPMFALSAPPEETPGTVLFVLSAAALTVAAGGALAGSGPIMAAAAAGGAGAAIAHVLTMEGIIAKGMRKRLGLSFVLVRASWLLLLASIAAGAMAAAGLTGDRGAALFGFLALFGWLLTFLLGILQRIIPFLVAMNAGKYGSKPPRLSDIAEEFPLKVHAACHFAALALVAAGIVSGGSPLVLAGGLLGLAGSLAFLWFTLHVLWRMRALGPAEAGPEPQQQSSNGTH